MLPLENLTVSQLLRRTAARFPARPALEYQAHMWTYQALDAQVDQTARRLLAWGIRRGARVGLWCEAEPNAIFLLYALFRIGAAATLLNTSLQRTELVELLRCTDVDYLIISDGYKGQYFPEICRNLIQELPCLQSVLSIGQEGGYDGLPTLDCLMEASEQALLLAEAEVTAQDIGTILYTSGTTSSPKAVMSTQYSRVNSGIQQAHDLGATETDRFCVAIPMFHCFCLSVNLIAACAVGACLYLPENRKTSTLLKAVSVGKCTILSSVPTLFHAILCRPDFQQWDLSSLRTGFIGGSFYPPELFRQINDGFGFTLLSSLGQTEATAGLTAASLDDPLETRAETVGHFMDHVEGKIVHIETGEPQPVGSPGEICVRGYLVMAGYYHQPDATAQAIDADGWLHTGDIGYLDGNGNIHLTGRLKELIIRGGENISPAEIEMALGDCPEIKECKAVGVPDRHYGEEICLCIVPQNGATIQKAAVCFKLAQRLAEFKIPKYILFLEALPRTTTGKIRPAELSKLAQKYLNIPSYYSNPQNC